ncbi:hypothetical protein AAF712_016399 [Marasmius tenuissimus]|uniref:Uncharacterized protein n=1 Tax=Marasmius tenuissimus TaxID=585030 RepID=A0ABR2Z5T2_9AGAR
MMRLPRKNDDLKDFARKFLSTFGTGELFTLPQTGPVWVSISADGNRLVYLVRDSGRITVVNSDTTSNSFDKVDSRLQPALSVLPSEVRRGARCVAISPNGCLVAVGFNEPREGKRVVVWDLEKRSAIQRNHEKNSILDVRFSSDNERVYYSTSGPSGHVVWSWSVLMKESTSPPREIVDTLDGMEFYGPDGVITGLSVSQDSKRLVATSEDDKVYMWDVESPKTVISGDYRARAVTFPTDHCFYTGGDDGTILRWTWSDGTFSTEELTKRNASINALAGADERLACGLDDALGTVEIFDVSANPIKPVGEKMHHHSAIYSLSYAEKERRCIAAGTRYRGGVTLWDEEGPGGGRLLDHVSNEDYFFK